MKLYSKESGSDFKEKFLSGVYAVAKVVGESMGPHGKTLMYYDNDGQLNFTKDGATIAKLSNDEHPAIKAGMDFCKHFGIEMEKKRGDGTSSVTVLAAEMIRYAESAELNHLSFETKFKVIIDDIIAHIDNIKMRAYEHDMFNIAMTASNHDEVISKNVVELFTKTNGDYGYHLVESQSGKNEIFTIPGFTMPITLADPGYSNSPKGFNYKDQVNIILYQDKMTDVNDLKKIIQDADGGYYKPGPIIIIGEDFLPECITLSKTFKQTVILCKHQLRNNEKEEVFNELFLLTGAKPYASSWGYQKHTVKFGLVSNINIDMNQFRLYSPKKSGAKKLVDKYQDVFENGKIGERSRMKMKITELEIGTVIYYWSTKNEIEKKEYKDRIDDTIKACKQIIEDGVIPGGNQAIAKYLSKVTKDPSINVNVDNSILIVLTSPLRNILINSGKLELFNIACEHPTDYVNLKTNKFEKKGSFVKDSAAIVKEQYLIAYQIVKTYLQMGTAIF